MTRTNQPDATGRSEGNGDSQGPLLVAVDFSEDSREAVLWASREAERLGVRLMILHVVHDPASSPGFYRQMDPDWFRPMADLAHEMMDAFLKETRTKHPSLSALATAETKLVTGLPSGRIVEVAQAINAPLIVVGSRGRTGLPHILLGSVAERVVQLAPMPIVVVKRR
jgi:nucleotide-binding universal stress UspA family protein